jgi:hypothetical protein
MLAITFIPSFCVCRQPRDVFAADMPFAATDRAIRKAVQDRHEHLDVARRYWASPF